MQQTPTEQTEIDEIEVDLRTQITIKDTIDSTFIHLIFKIDQPEIQFKTCSMIYPMTRPLVIRI